MCIFTLEHLELQLLHYKPIWSSKLILTLAPQRTSLRKLIFLEPLIDTVLTKKPLAFLTFCWLIHNFDTYRALKVLPLHFLLFFRCLLFIKDHIPWRQLGLLNFISKWWYLIKIWVWIFWGFWHLFILLLFFFQTRFLDLLKAAWC